MCESRGAFGGVLIAVVVGLAVLLGVVDIDEFAFQNRLFVAVAKVKGSA